MNKKSIGKFLKENNAIFSYIKDDNGYRIGMIIGVKSNDPNINEPKIGVAFFNEASILGKNNSRESTDCCGDSILHYESEMDKIKDCPALMNKINSICSFKSEVEAIGNMDLPFEGYWKRYPVYFNPRYIKKFETLTTARQRVNFNRLDFYEVPDEYVYRYLTLENLHKQIRKFEYRALRYFKYIPGLKKNK